MRRSWVALGAAVVLSTSTAFAQAPQEPSPVAAPAQAPPAPPRAEAFPPPPPPDLAPPALRIEGAATDGLPGARARRPAYWRERLRLLNASLPPLAERSRDSRRSEILINSITGAVAISLGFIFSSDDAAGPFPAQVLLWTQGSLLLAQGLAALAFPPARERLSDAFSALPQASARERHARVRFGEDALDRMAADGARRRVIGAVVGVASALLPMLIIYREPIFDGRPWPEPPELNVLAFSLSGLAALQSLIPLFSRSPEERLRDEYRTRVRILREGAENPD